MKTLSHLPNNKQAEIMAIAGIIREVVDPEMIVLFGSYAKGTFTEHKYIDGKGTRYEYISDYDFLVVTKTHEEKTHVQESAIENRADKYEPPVNLEIHGIDYINKGLEIGEYFFTDIIKEGVVLYDKGTVQFASPRILTAEEKKEKALRYFNTWFPQAGEFVIDAKNGYNRENYKKAAFELHQATECLYYTLLLVFTDYKPKIHNLWKLRKKAKPYSEELFLTFRAETDKQEEYLFDLLKRGYVDARYREDYVITKEELTTLIERVELMIPIVKSVCEQKIASIE